VARKSLTASNCSVLIPEAFYFMPQWNFHPKMKEVPTENIIRCLPSDPISNVTFSKKKNMKYRSEVFHPIYL
jgi:hypothetical protein